MNIEETYKKCLDTQQRLREQHAVLTSKVEDIQAEKAELEEKLQSAGVNLSDIDGEIERLEREIEESLSVAQQELQECTVSYGTIATQLKN